MYIYIVLLGYILYPWQVPVMGFDKPTNITRGLCSADRGNFVAICHFFGAFFRHCGTATYSCAQFGGHYNQYDIYNIICIYDIYDIYNIICIYDIYDIESAIIIYNCH